MSLTYLSPNSYPTFKTELDVIYNNQYFSPNDWYEFTADFFAFDNATNEALSIILSLENSGGGDFATLFNVREISTNSTDLYPAGGGAAHRADRLLHLEWKHRPFSPRTGNHLFHVLDQLGVDFVFDNHNVGHIQPTEGGKRGGRPSPRYSHLDYPGHSKPLLRLTTLWHLSR